MRRLGAQNECRLDQRVYLRDEKHMTEYDHGFVEFIEGRVEDWKLAGM